MTILAWTCVQLVAVIVPPLRMCLFSVSRKFFTVCKGPITPFEVASFHAFVLVLLFLEFGHIESRVRLPQRLCEDVDDFAPFEIFSTSFSQHVFSIDVMFRISKVGKDTSCFPRIEERVCDEGSYPRVSLDRINVVQVMTKRILVTVQLKELFVSAALPVFSSRSLKDAYAGGQDRQPELGIALSSLPPLPFATFRIHVTMIPFPS